MKINKELITKLQSYGFNLSPAVYGGQYDKAPGRKSREKWRYDWSEEELSKSKRIGVFHDPSSTYDIDFDDKSFVAHQFHSLLPDTFSIGKQWKGSATLTHKVYALPKGVKIDKWSYPKKVLNGSGKIIELLNKFTVLADQDRTIIRDVKPVVADPADILNRIKMIAFFTEIKNSWSEEGSRDEAYLRLTGALARDTDIPINVQKEFIERLCEITNDREIKNRVDKVDYQHNQVAEGKNVYGIKELATWLNVNLPAFDELKRVTDDVSEPLATGLTFLNGNEFTIKDFPKPEYVLHPIVANQQIRQMFAKAGTGKSLYSLHEGCAIASGYDFLNYKHSGKKTPVLIVEGEMDSSSIQNRLFDVESAYEMEGKELNKNFIFFATLAIQNNMHFESLTKEVGRLNVEITAKEIEKITGTKPIIYLDNITALTIMQEKEGAEWVELMHWLSRLRNKGYHVTFLHHPTKTGETASGSNVKERSIDIDMKLTTPDEKTLVEEYEDNHTQMSIEFLKWREHMNTSHSKKRIAIINRTTGKWLIVPMFNKTQRKIYKMLKEGKDPAAIIDYGKATKSEGMSKANVYKVVKILKSEGVLEDEKPSK
tara:strand:+ start:170 stop:1963 length:1794 start_codon:yes stop_codon:yes gene_type:complete